MTDCSDVVQVGSGLPLYINIDYTPLGCLGCLPLATEATTWSRVKALYR